jgi:hypothetical protein
MASRPFMKLHARSKSFIKVIDFLTFILLLFTSRVNLDFLLDIKAFSEDRVPTIRQTEVSHISPVNF